jgi:transaldolase
MAKSRLHELAERGQSVWFDTLARDLVHTGELKRMMDEDAVVGVTSNPTIFQKALSSGDAYDDDLKQLLGKTDDATEIFFSLALQDIRDACDVLKPAYDASDGVDGYVSMEVEPGIAYDTERTFEQVQWIAKEVGRPNLYVKIPATMPGLPAIEDSIAHGTSINITLIFSLERYKAVVEAYLRGLERLIAHGGDPSEVVSVASFFVSRVDTEADKRLEAAGHSELAGKLANANAKLAYQHFLQAFSGERWAYLEGKGAKKQRCLWASTSTKNPAYRDVMYVEELIGPETVNTMPLETIEAFQDHGEVRGDTVLEGVDEAQALLERLAAVGVDYDDVTATLEAEGVQKFVDSFDAIVESIRAKRSALAAA